jgi:putative two-component system response regulator
MALPHLEDLESLLHSKNGGDATAIKVALIRLSAEIKGRMKKSSPESVDFFTSAVRTVGRLRGAAHADIRMDCLFDSCMFLMTNGLSAQALDGVEQIERLAAHTKTEEWRRKAATISGIIHADLGNIAESVVSCTKALIISRETADLLGESTALINLGCGLIYGGLFREAIPCLERSAQLSRAEGYAVSASQRGIQAADIEAAALTNMAQCLLNLEEFGRAFRIMSRALEVSPEPRSAIEATSRTIREFTYVQLALRLGMIDEAREHTELCERYGLMAGTVRSRVVARISRGLWEVHAGDVDQGLGILEEQLSTADLGVFRTEALAALVQCYELAGRADRALECLTQLLVQTRRARQDGIVALLSLPHHDTVLVTPESEDLRHLTGNEFRLRAKVAELELANSRLEMFERLAVTADLREESSGEHGYRVGRLASLLANEVGWPRDACFAIEVAARLHDIGKAGMPDRILLKSLELKEAERHFMNTHTTVGAELLANGNSPHLRMAEEIARFHHEWWNGAGYPTKLSGERIPIHARIVALADVFDALTHGRPYSEPWPVERALREISSRRGEQFDPELTDRFLALMARLLAEHENLDAYLAKAGQNSTFLRAREKLHALLAKERERERDSAVSGAEVMH